MFKLKEFYTKIPQFLKNKYFIIGLLFIIWIVFIDENNLIYLNKKINKLEEKEKIIVSLENEISEMEEKLEKLNNNLQELEKFARENVLMKKENEEIIIIREKLNE